MWASPIETLGEVAVVAKKLELGREIVVNQPSMKYVGLVVLLFTVLVSATVDMIHRKELIGGDTAALALSAISGNDLSSKADSIVSGVAV
jgi:hypothetical protein